MKTVCVVGAGPAGLAAAIHAASGGSRAILVEKNPQPGVKLLATGGGRANLGNLLPMPEWPARFGRRGRFIVPALSFLPCDRYRQWLAGIGVETGTADGFHLYPSSGSARQVRDALVGEALRLGVELLSGQAVTSLTPGRNGGAPSMMLANGDALDADAVILACGGKSLPSSGSAGDGYRLAEQAGHRIRTTVPALVGLKVRAWDDELGGLTFPDALVRFRPRGQPPQTGRRELLLTRNGVSGPAVLDLSGAVAEHLESHGSTSVDIQWIAGTGKREWRELLDDWRRRKGTNRCDALLGSLLPRRFAKWLCRRTGLPEGTTAATVTAGDGSRLVDALSAFSVAITGTEGWDRAIVTRGGVDLAKVNPDTLESKTHPRLHFAGEVLDIDGPCGGYNLHWAFASGALAGFAAGGR